MPQLKMGEINYREFPKDIHRQYMVRIAAEQQKYWWIAFFLGGGLFFLSVMM